MDIVEEPTGDLENLLIKNNSQDQQAKKQNEGTKLIYTGTERSTAFNTNAQPSEDGLSQIDIDIADMEPLEGFEQGRLGLCWAQVDVLELPVISQGK